jgi:hypothetical protein
MQIVQVGWAHVFVTMYLGVAMVLMAASFKHYLQSPKKNPYPLTSAIWFGLGWPIFAPIAHAAMLHKWYKGRNFRRWKRDMLARKALAAIQKNS